MEHTKKGLLERYGSILEEYRQKVILKFSDEQLFEYNEILFSAHSCAIEGNSFTVDDTRELKEHGQSLKLYNKSMLEAFEILDHFKAFEYLFKNLKFTFSEKLLIDTQKLVTKNTIKYTKGYEPGEYTKTQMAAGDTIFPDYKISVENTPQLMEQTQQAIEAGRVHPIEMSAKFHQYFIYLHPFPDGNGRTGRLLSNYILAKAGHPLIIIKKEDKPEYINALKSSHKHKDLDIITSFFIKTSIDRMQQEIKQIHQSVTPKKDKKNKGMRFVF